MLKCKWRSLFECVWRIVWVCLTILRDGRLKGNMWIWLLDVAGFVSWHLYLISIFSSFLTVKCFIEKQNYAPFQIFWCALLKTQHYINNFVHELINFLQREVIKVCYIVLCGLHILSLTIFPWPWCFQSCYLGSVSSYWP